ncbi:isoafricanol synthase [Streptomyces sp. XD-27]|uniref:isoafricanol synthase n=1 Tax=Streptomyces sp. XD-27 TaxID=3062779 RepID=UPI0026F42F4D|nr:isoafricanol synthase [Streptomyces sp. XD-27]WKX73679.1 isoafricanol synthase [Streptomyces sp. XD-27]
MTVRPRAQRSELARRIALLDIPAGRAVSPDGEAARVHTINWLRRFGVFAEDAAVAEYDALRLDRLSALFWPQATGAELDLANDINGWVFVFDDQFDGALGCRPDAVSRLVDDLVGITREPTPAVPTDVEAHPLLASFRDLWQRLDSGMPPVWRERTRANWVDYLRAYTREAQGKAEFAPRSLAALLSVRRHSIGVHTCLDLHERFSGYALPRAVHDGALLTAMRAAADDVVIFVNDIVSLDKELAAGDVYNSVILWRERGGCTLEGAVRHIAGLANSRYRYFEELAARLPAALAEGGASPELLRHAALYADGMRHVMRGNVTWSLETARYDERGVAAVSDGRQRPWADLAPLGELTAP